jgi:RNA polymerase sigma-70 factor (ECF subfamily)
MDYTSIQRRSRFLDGGYIHEVHSRGACGADLFSEQVAWDEDRACGRKLTLPCPPYGNFAFRIPYPQEETMPTGSPSTVLPDIGSCAEAADTSHTGPEVSPALWKHVFRYAYSLVGNHAEAEDIAQDTFVALFQESRKGRTVEQIGGWMRTVARRAAYRQYNRTRPDLHVPLEYTAGDGETSTLDLPDSKPSTEEIVINDQMLSMGARVISSYPEREQECIMMFFRGYDFAQIAATLQISRWTARRVTLKAIAKLQNRLGRPPR